MASIRLNHGSRQQVRSRIEKALRSQYVVVTPPPVNALDVYYKLVMSQELVAYVEQVEARIPSLIRRASDFYLDVNVDTPLMDGIRRRNSVRSFYVDLPDDKPMPNVNGSYRNTFMVMEDNELFPSFADYIEQLHAIKVRNHKVRGVVHTVLNLCRTGGQLRLLWPELVTALPAYLRSELGDTVAKKPSADWLEYHEQLLLQTQVREATNVIVKSTLLESSLGGPDEVQKKLQQPKNGIKCLDIQ